MNDKKTLEEKLKELSMELERQKNNRYDIVVPSEQLIVLKDGDKIFIDVPQPSGDMKRHGITDYCHGQIADKTGIPMKYYRKMQDAGKLDLLAENINSWLPTKEKRLIRVLDGEVRAVLSDRYRIIDNYDVFYAVLDEFARIMRDTGIRIQIRDARLTDQHIYIKAVSPDLTGEVFHLKDRVEPVHGGIIISNSEVGAGSFQVKPFINVLVCQNGLISDKIFKRVHLGKELGCGLVNWSDETLSLEDKALWSKIRDMIRATFNRDVFQRWVDEINKVSVNVLEKPVEAVDNIIKKYNIPQSKKDALLNQFSLEGNTQWGLSMAVTRIAQDEESYEEQIKMEHVGAKILELKKEELVKEA